MDAYLSDLREGVGAIPRNCEDLVFEHPWQGRAFGLALSLADAKAYPWEDFRQSLIATIANWKHTHELDDKSWEYYEQWLSAFEKLAVEKGLVSSEEIDVRMEEFRSKAREEVI